MTFVQKALQRGRRVTESYRSVSVKVLPGGAFFPATIEIWEPEQAQNTPSQETRVTSILKIARTAITASALKIEIGNTFTNQVTNERYRIVKIEDNGQNILVLYHCETSQPS